MSGPEQRIQTAILKKLRERGAYTVKVITASRNGVPDVLVCFHGRFYGIEVKAPGGKVSAVQASNLQRITEAGGIALVAQSWSEIEQYFY